MTPSWAVVQMEGAFWSRRRQRWRVGAPLFLLWIPVVMLAPLWIVVWWGACLAVRVRPLRALAACSALVCGLRGSDVLVVWSGHRVRVRVW